MSTDYFTTPPKRRIHIHPKYESRVESERDGIAKNTCLRFCRARLRLRLGAVEARSPDGMAIVIAGWLVIHGRQSFTAAIACDVHRRSKLSQSTVDRNGEREVKKKRYTLAFWASGLIVEFLAFALYASLIPCCYHCLFF